MPSRLRRISLAIAFAACLPAVALAQTPGFHAVYSRDGVDAWAVGDTGLCYRSLDAGLSWGTLSLGPSRLRDVVARGLTVMAVGDSGKIWRSTNSGGTWSLTVVAGTPALMSIAMPTAAIGYVVGANGTILRTGDGGANWTPEVSGTVNRLNAVSFEDEQFGWAVGENGTVLATADDGANWTPVAVGTTSELYSVMQRGTRVWVVGARGTALKSVNSGASFTAVNLKLDAHSDVRAVWLAPVDSVYIAGGGGFLWRSADNGATWFYPVHNMHGQISDIMFANGVGFIVSNRNRLPMSSIDRGTTWRFPTGAALSRTWVNKLPFSGTVRGSTFGLNDIYSNTIYCALGATVYRSRDEGETWTSIATITQSAKVNAFYVSPKDTNVFVAAVSGIVAKRLVKSDDHGLTWNTVLTQDFGEYGIPLAYDHDHPDTVFFGGDASPLFRSTDAGKNWEAISNITFRSPCDIGVVPDSSNIILVGDGITGSGQGQVWKSSDGGFTFTVKQTRPPGVSEIPGMSNSRLRPGTAFVTNWGSGGVQRSQDFGETWPNASSVVSAWGTDIARDDPNVVIFGTYSGGSSWLSLDGGDTFVSTPLPGSNYGFYLRDRGTILAEQSAGVYKMTFTYNYVPQNGQSAFVLTPNGGEAWNAGTAHDIQWSAVNVPLVNVEFRATAVDPWQLIARVPGYEGHFNWVVPNVPTLDGKVRVRDAWDAAPEDSSNASFSINGAAVSVGGRPGAAFSLWQNRPNPFTGATQISYALPYETDVDLDVYDLQGQRVATLVRGRQPAGTYSVAFGSGVRTATGVRLAGVPAGVYFYRMKAGDFGLTRKMLLMK